MEHIQKLLKDLQSDLEQDGNTQPVLLRFSLRLTILEEIFEELIEDDRTMDPELDIVSQKIITLLEQIYEFIKLFQQSTGCSKLNLWSRVALENAYCTTILNEFLSITEMIDECLYLLLPSCVLNFAEQYHLDLDAFEEQIDLVVDELYEMKSSHTKEELIDFVRPFNQVDGSSDLISAINMLEKNFQAEQCFDVQAQEQIMDFFPIRKLAFGAGKPLEEKRQYHGQVQKDVKELLKYISSSSLSLRKLSREYPASTVATQSELKEPAVFIQRLIEQMPFIPLPELIRLQLQLQPFVQEPSLLSLPIELIRLILSFLSTTNLFRLDSAMTSRRYRETNWRPLMIEQLNENTRSFHGNFIQKNKFTPPEQISSRVFFSQVSPSIFYIEWDQSLVILNINTRRCKVYTPFYMFENYSENYEETELEKDRNVRVCCIYQMKSSKEIIVGHENGRVSRVGLQSYKQRYQPDRIGRVPHSGPISYLTELLDGRVISGSESGIVSVWGLNGIAGPSCSIYDGHNYYPIRSIVPLPDGDRVVTGAQYSNQMMIWNFTTRQVERSVSTGLGSIFCLVALADGGYAVAGELSGKIEIWTADFRACPKELEGWSDGTTLLLQLIDGRLVGPNHFDGEVMVLDIETNETKLLFDFGFPVHSLNQLPDGRLVCYGKDQFQHEPRIAIYWPENY